jgi:ornithine decarboxylase
MEASLEINEKDEVGGSNNTNNLLKYLRSKYTISEIKFDEGKASSIVSQIIKTTETDEPITIIDLAAIYDQYLNWNKYLPKVYPFFAIKSCDVYCILDLLSQLNCGFDVASKNELKLVKKLGVDKSRLIYTNPSKQISHLLYAKENSITRLTVDSPFEMEKISKHYPEAELFIRIKTNGVGTTWSNFSSRFGCLTSDYEILILKAKSLKLKVIGVSFHVGYRSSSPETYFDSLSKSLSLIEIAEKNDFKIQFVNIGGGYPGYSWDVGVEFSEIAKKINEGIDLINLKYPEVQFIAEPGRYMVSRSMILLLQVIGKKQSTVDGFDWYYTITQGHYGMFRGSVEDEPNNNIRHFKEHGKKFKSKFYGPTCDSYDLVKICDIEELDIGDWIYFVNCGAYFFTCASGFNGFSEREEHLIWRNDSLEGDCHLLTN